MAKPLCMTASEYAAWTEQNERLPLQSHLQASTPCHDCLGRFAAEMRSEGCCDGEPGKQKSTAPWPSRTADYKRDKARDYRRRQGMVDMQARTQERIARARQLYATGMTHAEVAKLMGVARNTVTVYLRKAAA